MTPDDRVARALDEVAPAPSAVTIGFFDGVHRGHQAIVGRAVRAAEQSRLRSVAVTFDRHPAEVVRPGAQPPYLMSLDQRVGALLDQRVDMVLVLAFTRELSQLSPQDFVERVLAGPLAARTVVVGTNFTFGHRAAGDVVTLTDLGATYGFDAEAVTLLHLDDVPISSTAIRDRVAAGDVAWARSALGRPYTVVGTVTKGDGRGRRIGVPTANVEVDDTMVLPATGVYAGRAHTIGPAPSVAAPAVVNVGSRPTFAGGDVTVEAHLLDVDVDLYGEDLAVALEHRLRDEQRFEGVDALVEQIRRDVERARGLLAT